MATKRKRTAAPRRAKRKAGRTAGPGKKRAQPIPAGFHTVTPYLVLSDAAGAIDFYKRAFGAKEKFRMAGPGGKVMHAEIQVGDSRIMVADEMPERGAKSPAALGGSPASIFLYVRNVDAAVAKAAAAGATVTMAVQDMFWGDRYGRLRDPFGYEWQMATHKEDLTPKQIADRARTAMSPAP
jgi:PhnB protein